MDSAFPTEDKGSVTDKAYSARRLSSVKRRDATHPQEQTLLGTKQDSQGTRQQPSEVELPLVISVAATKDGIREQYVASPILDSGTQGLSITSKKHLKLCKTQSEIAQKEHTSVLPLQCQTERKKKGQKHAAVNREACDAVKRGPAEVEATSQSDLQVQGGQRKQKAKHLQQPVTGILKSVIPGSPEEKNVKKNPAGQVEDVEMPYVGDTVNIITSESPQAHSVDPRESALTATVQKTSDSLSEDVKHRDGNSLVVSAPSCSDESSSKSPLFMDVEEERMIQSPITEDSSANDTVVTPPAEPPQAPVVKPRVRQSSVTLQDAMLLVDLSMAGDACSSAPKVTTVPQTQCAYIAGALQTLDEVPAQPQTHPPIVTQSSKETTGTNPTNKAQAHIAAVIKKQHTVSLSNASTSSMPPSAAAAKESVQSLLHQHPHVLKTSVAPSREKKTETHKIVVVPRPASLVPLTITGPTPSQSVVSLVLAAQKRNLVSGSRAAGTPQGTPSPSSLPQKKMNVRSIKSMPIVVVPRLEPAALYRKQQVTKQPVSATSAASLSSPPVTSVSVQTQTTITSHKRKPPSNKVESPNQSQSQSVSDVEKTIAHTEVCSSFNMSGASVQNNTSTAQGISSKTPPSGSTKKPVLITTVPPNGAPDPDPVHVLKEESTQEESSVQTPEAQVSSSLKEPSVAVNTSEMSKAQNNIQEKVSSEMCSTLEQLPHGTHVQPSPFTSPSVPLQVSNPAPPSVPSKDCSDPHSQMTKCQFLAHLSVAPVTAHLNTVRLQAVQPDEYCFNKTDCAVSRKDINSLQVQIHGWFR